MPAKVVIEGRTYDLEHRSELEAVRGIITSKLDLSDDAAMQKRAIELAATAGRRVSGTVIVPRIEEVFRAARDLRLKREALTALAKIDDPRSRPLFVAQLDASDPPTAALAGCYLIRRMYREEADKIVGAIIRGAGMPDAESITARSWSQTAFVKLQEMADKHGRVLPRALFVADPAARVAGLNSWWQANRDAVIEKLPPRPQPATTTSAPADATQPVP